MAYTNDKRRTDKEGDTTNTKSYFEPIKTWILFLNYSLFFGHGHFQHDSTPRILMVVRWAPKWGCIYSKPPHKPITLYSLLLAYPSSKRKKSILFKHWLIIQQCDVFKEKPNVIHNCSTSLKHYLVHSQLIPPTHKQSTMNKLPTVCQLCRWCSLCPFCNNITFFPLTK